MMYADAPGEGAAKTAVPCIVLARNANHADGCDEHAARNPCGFVASNPMGVLDATTNGIESGDAARMQWAVTLATRRGRPGNPSVMRNWVG